MHHTSAVRRRESVRHGRRILECVFRSRRRSKTDPAPAGSRPARPVKAASWAAPCAASVQLAGAPWLDAPPVSGRAATSMAARGQDLLGQQPRHSSEPSAAFGHPATRTASPCFLLRRRSIPSPGAAGIIGPPVRPGRRCIGTYVGQSGRPRQGVARTSRPTDRDRPDQITSRLAWGRPPPHLALVLSGEGEAHPGPTGPGHMPKHARPHRARRRPSSRPTPPATRPSPTSGAVGG